MKCVIQVILNLSHIQIQIFLIILFVNNLFSHMPLRYIQDVKREIKRKMDKEKS